MLILPLKLIVSCTCVNSAAALNCGHEVNSVSLKVLFGFVEVCVLLAFWLGVGFFLD